MHKYYSFTRSKRAFFITLSFLLILAVIPISKTAKSALANYHSNKITVVIDAGHGGIDGGVLGKISKTKESDLNLIIAKKLKSQFENAGFSVVMTRSSFGGLYGATSKGFKLRDMKKRIKIINSSSASAMISVHLNYYSDPARRGATVFFNQNSAESRRLAEYIQKYFNSSSASTRDLSPLKGDYYLLNESFCPAVICECGFLSNAEEEKLLLTDEYQTEIANLIFLGASAFLLG